MIAYSKLISVNFIYLMAKTEVESLDKITIKWLRDEGYFQGKVAPLLKGISFTTTKCHLGGERFWFTCKCGKRVGVLYVSGDEFRCRKCLNLTYHSQNIRKSIRNDVMLSAMDSLIKAKELQQQAKRYTYRGQPTKKQQKIGQLYFRYLKVANML